MWLNYFKVTTKVIMERKQFPIILGCIKSGTREELSFHGEGGAFYLGFLQDRGGPGSRRCNEAITAKMHLREIG